MGKIEISKKALLLCLISLSLGSCISRLSRPEINGVIVDYDKKPVVDCKVGEGFTTKDGSFILPEKRYNSFFLTEIMSSEAPLVFVSEVIEKDGFESDAISFLDKFGGGKSKGAKYNIDTIFLKKNDQQFDVSAILNNSKWKLAYTKNADTLYLLKDGFKAWCKTERCSPFYNKYELLTDNYYHKAAKNLPDGMIKRFIDINFKAKQSVVKIKEIKQYDATFNGSNRAPDTLNTNGIWELLSNDIIQLRIDEMKSISGRFKIAEIDLYQLKLIRIAVAKN